MNSSGPTQHQRSAQDTQRGEAHLEIDDHRFSGSYYDNSTWPRPIRNPVKRILFSGYCIPNLLPEFNQQLCDNQTQTNVQPHDLFDSLLLFYFLLVPAPHTSAFIDQNAPSPDPRVHCAVYDPPSLSRFCIYDTDRDGIDAR